MPKIYDIVENEHKELFLITKKIKGTPWGYSPGEKLRPIPVTNLCTIHTGKDAQRLIMEKFLNF